jgi:hypothetical protein
MVEGELKQRAYKSERKGKNDCSHSDNSIAKHGDNFGARPFSNGRGEDNSTVVVAFPEWGCKGTTTQVQHAQSRNLYSPQMFRSTNLR